MDFLKAAIATAIVPYIHHIFFTCVFSVGFLFGIGLRFSGLFLSLALFLAIPVGIFCLIELVGCARKCAKSCIRRQWPQATGHALIPLFGLASLFAGFFGSVPATIAYAGLRLELALANERNISGRWDQTIEIISTSPQIAMYKVGYGAGFAIPGFTSFILLDRSGRFKEFAEAGHARDLAGTLAIRSSNYAAWCKNLMIRHRFGPFYSAVLDDEVGCNDF